MGDWNKSKRLRKVEWYMKHEEEMASLNLSAILLLRDIEEFNNLRIEKPFLTYLIKKHNFQTDITKWEKVAKVIEDALIIMREAGWIVASAYGPVLTEKGIEHMNEPPPRIEWTEVVNK